MINKEHISQEVEKTLNSLEGIQRVPSNPHLFTRIKARMEPSGRWEKIVYFISRPAIAYSVLILLLAINAWVLFSNTTPAQESNGVAISDIADEYNLSASTNYDYEKLSNE